MAMTGIIRPGMVQIRVLEMEPALRHYRDVMGLIEVSREVDGRVYLKCFDEFDRHSVVLREAEGAGMDYMAFKTATEADLDRYAQRIRDFGAEVEEVPADEQPGVGRRISFLLPTGHRLDLFAEMALSDQGPMTENPDIWSSEPRGMRATRFDHCLLYGPAIEENVAFFTQVLDFELSEKVTSPEGDIAVFLTCSTKAHDIAFVRHPEPNKFHHASFYLLTWEDVGHAADLISRHDVALDIGPTRHGITRGQTIYFFDPSGNRNEVFTGGYTYYPGDPLRVWDHTQIGKAIFYHTRELNERFLGVVT